jgi:aerobic-type carbon monoxide dehydrogenase small subunit (CoxS/CutS family)
LLGVSRFVIVQRMPRYALTIDGTRREIDADADMPLLYALRGQLALKGAKFGCGLAQCGACTVIVNGNATRSCVIPVSALDGATVRTLDGLGTAEKPHPVQAAFIAEEAAQCGYCTNGWIMTAVAGLESNPNPTDAEIRAMLAGLKCRCGTHMAILRAVRRAADAIAGDDDSGAGA